MAGVAVLKLKHIGINKQLTVPIVITSFETTAKPNWASNNVYGRMDPIFTYQNTVRTFTAVLRTPRANEKFTQKQYEVFTSAAGGKSTTAFSPSGAKYTYIGGPNNYMRDIADLYKMMYPVYYPLDVGNRAASFLTAAPLLTLNLSGIAYDGLAGTSLEGVGDGLLFVPETFKVNSLVDSKKASITVSSAEDLRFFANAEGYTITLGGTIVHRHVRPGFYQHPTGPIVFTQGPNFPYSTDNRSKFSGIKSEQERLSENLRAATARHTAEDRCAIANAAMDEHLAPKPAIASTDLEEGQTMEELLGQHAIDDAAWSQRFDELELEQSDACSGLE